jgi:hypothetical protein
MAREQEPVSVTTGADIEDALRRAETLMASAEDAARRRRALLVAEVGALSLAITAAALGTGLSAWMSGARLALVWAVVLLAGVLVAAVIHVTLTVPLRHRVRREARAAMDIVDFLREVRPMVSEREGWSETRLHVVKARLARFPIDASAIR